MRRREWYRAKMRWAVMEERDQGRVRRKTLRTSSSARSASPSSSMPWNGSAMAPKKADSGWKSAWHGLSVWTV